MATGTLGSVAGDYPRRNSVIAYPLLFASPFGAGTSVKAGTIPAGAAILRAYCTQGATPFNAATTNTIALGTAAGGAQLVTAAAMGAANSLTTLTVLPAGIGPLTADTPVWVTYAHTGTPATAGAGLLVIEYANPTGQ